MSSPTTTQPVSRTPLARLPRFALVVLGAALWLALVALAAGARGEQRRLSFDDRSAG